MNDTTTINQSQEKDVTLWEELKNTTQLKKSELPTTPSECAITINIKDSKGNEHSIDIIGMWGDYYRKKVGVYLIHCLGNNKIYIGSALNLYIRIYDHRRYLRLNTHPNTYLQNSYNKYGIDMFRFYIISECPILEKDDLETWYIKKYDKFGILFNVIKEARGSMGRKMSQESKDKISRANTGKPSNKLGVPMSIEQRKLLSIIKTDTIGKHIKVFTLNGEFIETIRGIGNTYRKYNIRKHILQRILRGKIYGSDNYTFRYVEDEFAKYSSKLRLLQLERSVKIYQTITTTDFDVKTLAQMFDCSEITIIRHMEKYISSIYTKIQLFRKASSSEV